jgi:2,3-diketo-5-methylthio-1-phosphopentane phosphatase
MVNTNGIVDLSAMRSNPKYIFFTDFDGTITLQDSNDYMTDNIGFGTALRKQGNKDVLDGVKTFRDSFKEMMDSIDRPYSECIQFLVDNVKLDPYFRNFLKYADSINMPVIILSGGMTPIIKGLLKALVGSDADNIQIVSNHVKLRDGYQNLDESGGWEIEFHDDSSFGHDKSLTIRPYAQLPLDKRPMLFYAGDGVSDLSAARETDLLFAKNGKDLVTYCVREDVPFTIFEDWRDIEKVVGEIVYVHHAILFLRMMIAYRFAIGMARSPCKMLSQRVTSCTSLCDFCNLIYERTSADIRRLCH